MTVLPLIVALACVLANGFFVAAEFALAKVRPTALEALAKDGDRRAARALLLTKRLDAYLTASQLGITMASLALGWLGEPAIKSLLEKPMQSLGFGAPVIHGVSAGLGFAVITLLHILVGEQMPKFLAIQRPEAVARHTAFAMQAFFYASYPLLWVLNTVSNLMLRGLGLPATDYAEGALSVEELRLIVRASFKDTTGTEATKRDLLERVLRGTDRPARAIMVPRVDIVTLSLTDDVDTWLKKARRYGYSRYPLSEDGEADRIIGYLYIKDLLIAPDRSAEGLRALKRDVLFVPESRTVGEVLADFQRTKIPIAIIVDEYGGTAGLVTLEDAVEEIVGEIQDELDREQPRMTLREDGTVVVDGSLLIDELALDGLRVAGGATEGETIGGYIIGTLGRLAHPGDEVAMGSYVAVVEDVRRRRVSRVALRPRTATAPAPPPETEGS